MKAVKVELQIKRITLNKDDSVSFSASTPELTDEELGAFRTMGKVLVNALLEPHTGSEGILEIKERVDDGKTPAQRLRAALFVWWEQQKRSDDFEVFYRMNMEKLIDLIKSKLE